MGERNGILLKGEKVACLYIRFANIIAYIDTNRKRKKKLKLNLIV